MESERLELHKSLVNEISKGMEQVKQLEVSCSSNEQERVLNRILSSYEEALSILAGRTPEEQCQSVITSLSACGSSTAAIEVTEFKGARPDLYKRKTRRREVRTVKIKTSGVALDDDGYDWRKYGQKEILGSNYPRSYYRCSHRHTRGCVATKQVQKSADDPTIFECTYIGVHICKAVALASNPES